MASEEDYKKAEWYIIDGFQRHDHAWGKNTYTEFTGIVKNGNFTQNQLNQLLHSAIGDGSPNHPNKYLYFLVEEAKADVNALVGGETALHTAARLGNDSHCYYLLGHGANPNLADNKGNKPRDVVPGNIARGNGADVQPETFDPAKMQWDSKPNYSNLEFNALEINTFFHDTKVDFLGPDYRKHLHDNNQKKAHLLEYAEKHPQVFSKLNKAPKPIILEDLQDLTQEQWDRYRQRFGNKKQSGSDVNAKKRSSENVSDTLNVFAPIIAFVGTIGAALLSGAEIGIGTILTAIGATLAVAVGTQYFTKTGAFAPKLGDAKTPPAKDDTKKAEVKEPAAEKVAKPELDAQTSLDANMQNALRQHRNSDYQPAAPLDAQVNAPPVPKLLDSGKQFLS